MRRISFHRPISIAGLVVVLVLVFGPLLINASGGAVCIADSGPMRWQLVDRSRPMARWMATLAEATRTFRNILPDDRLPTVWGAAVLGIAAVIVAATESGLVFFCVGLARAERLHVWQKRRLNLPPPADC
ncbi:MAG: hypothetical protein IT443_08355 [Phycisphaeraceae bacterium]|nr:hypothetical protein [Phycisphaeraceae bacterium]